MKINNQILIIFFFFGFALIISPYLFHLLELDVTEWISFILTIIGIVISVLVSWYYSTLPKYNWMNKLVKIVEGCQIVGLRSIEPKLKHGTSTLSALRKDFHSSFDFLGIGGGKFIKDMLKDKTIMDKVFANERKIRIMLLDPDGEKIGTWLYKTGKREKAIKIINENIKLLKDRAKECNCNIELRLYDTKPPMRIQIVNKEIAYIAEYDPSHNGYEAPQLIFDKNEGELDFKRPFVESLNNLFDFLWNKSDNKIIL